MKKLYYFAWYLIVQIPVTELDSPSAQFIIFEYLIENSVLEPTAKWKKQRSRVSAFAIVRLYIDWGVGKLLW